MRRMAQALARRLGMGKKLPETDEAKAQKETIEKEPLLQPFRPGELDRHNLTVNPWLLHETIKAGNLDEADRLLEAIKNDPELIELAFQSDRDGNTPLELLAPNSAERAHFLMSIFDKPSIISAYLTRATNVYSEVYKDCMDARSQLLEKNFREKEEIRKIRSRDQKITPKAQLIWVKKQPEREEKIRELTQRINEAAQNCITPKQLTIDFKK